MQYIQYDARLCFTTDLVYPLLYYADVSIVNTNAPELLNTSNRNYVVTQCLNTLCEKLFLKGNCAAMDDLLLQFMILNHITGPVKQFASQLTAQHAQQPGSSSAWPRGERVQIVRQVVHAGVRSVNRCPSETFNHLHHQPWMSHFLCVHHFITAGREPPVFQHLHSTLQPFSDRWWVTCDRERDGSQNKAVLTALRSCPLFQWLGVCFELEVCLFPYRLGCMIYCLSA